MDRILQAFKECGKKAALIPFLTAGDPTFDASLQMFQSVLSSGADLVEIGVPYSDPLADGPVIQAASLRSLKGEFKLPREFELTAELRKHTDKGLVLFSYINPVLQYTPQRFFSDAKASGADGIIVPDLPFEESEAIRTMADDYGIALIPLITPTSGDDRIEAIASHARGFVYCVAALGVTGERAKLSNRVEELVQKARLYTDAPIAVGFGVSGPDQAKAIASYSDGVIVGSAFIRRVEQALGASGEVQVEALTEAVGRFAAELAQAMVY